MRRVAALVGNVETSQRLEEADGEDCEEEAEHG